MGKSLWTMSLAAFFIIITLLILVALGYNQLASPEDSQNGKEKNSSEKSAASAVQGAAVQEDSSVQDSTAGDKGIQNFQETNSAGSLNEEASSNSEEEKFSAKKINPQNPEIEIQDCTAEMRNIDSCIPSYQLVCGWFDPAESVCTQSPCVQLFANECSACADTSVLYWNEGDCPLHA